VRSYELMYILQPELTPEAIEAIKERIKGIITNTGGEFEQEADGWGKRRLAYEINDYREGYYVVWYFKGQPETVTELDRVMKISETFLRHMILRLDEQ
jgi:small subunit ribosomal protein S6